MFPLTIGLALTLFIAIVIVRFGFRRASSLWELAKYGVMTTLAAFFLVFIGLAFQFNSRMERDATTLPTLTRLDDALRSEADGRYMLLHGQLSDENDPAELGNDYLAYVRRDRDDGDTEYRLPDLLLALEGGVVQIEGGAYEQIGWHEASSAAFQTTEYLAPNDEVIVYGRGYLGNSLSQGVREERLFLSAPFVFQGDVAAYESELVPTLKRRATYAQAASTFSYIAALLVLLSPLPKGLRLLRNR